MRPTWLVELMAMSHMNRLLHGVRVFMTGGSSFVPAVRRLFEERFGEERIRCGEELTSVASGLALRALD